MAISNGLIDDLRIYSRALSASEIKRLYNMGRKTLHTYEVCKAFGPIDDVRIYPPSPFNR